MTTSNQDNKMDSNRVASELELALIIRDELQKTFGSSLVDDVVKESLKGMLHAKKRETLAIHAKRMNELLAQLRDEYPVDSQIITDSQRNIGTLVDIRNTYLENIPSYIRFWMIDEKWEGLNFTLLIIPLILGVFNPPFGIAMLLFMVLTSAVDAFDFTRKNNAYWGWIDLPPSGKQPLTADELERLKQTFTADIVESFNPPKPIEKKISTLMYTTYIITFVIGLIGLAAFIFPPIGIPALALTLLTVLAISFSVIQGKSIYDKRQEQLANIQLEINHVEEKIHSDNGIVERMSSEITSRNDLSHPSEAGQHIMNDYELEAQHSRIQDWITNPFQWFHTPYTKDNENDNDSNVKIEKTTHGSSNIMLWFTNTFRKQPQDPSDDEREGDPPKRDSSHHH